VYKDQELPKKHCPLLSQYCKIIPLAPRLIYGPTLRKELETNSERARNNFWTVVL